MPASPAFCPNVSFCTLLPVLLGQQPDWAASGLNFRQQSNRVPRRDATWLQDHATAHASFRPISTLTQGPLLWRGKQSRDWSHNLHRFIWRSKEEAWGDWAFLCGTNFINSSYFLLCGLRDGIGCLFICSNWESLGNILSILLLPRVASTPSFSIPSFHFCRFHSTVPRSQW